MTTILDRTEEVKPAIEPIPNNNQDTINGLRAMADFLEANPELPPAAKGQKVALVIWPEHHGRSFQDVARLLGACRKKVMDSWFDAVKDFGGGVTLEVTVRREKVCTRVSTGTKTREVKELRELSPEEQATLSSFYETKTVEEEIVDWECDPAIVLGTEKAVVA